MSQPVAPGRPALGTRVAEAPCVVRVAGPVVTARGLPDVALGSIVRVGPLRLVGEVVQLRGADAIAQVYEDTTGLCVGDPVEVVASDLEVELGPGLLGSVFDGIQRPLERLARGGDAGALQPWLERGASAPALDRERRYRFVPRAKVGATVAAGDVLGTVDEGGIEHRILVPPGRGGVVRSIEAREAWVVDTIAELDDGPVCMLQRWPVRRPRPYLERREPREPLVTGQRVIDTLLPLARGGSATIPGGFGTGKTQTEQALAKWSDADVVVYVACGERGNELSELLRDFPALVDPRTGASLMARTVLIANTSNMPVAAREASIYTGLTIAEYFRDQGYHAAVLADSTSRWGEALREVSGRLQEMPGEEGYPAYLASRLAEFYERAASVVTLGADARRGSVSIIAAVSPPGGDFSEPVTQHSLRLAGTFWALDPELARRRHFPAIDVTKSYGLYEVGRWFAERTAPDWEEQRAWALALLQQERELLDTVALLGMDVLAPPQRLVLETGKSIREDFLQQSAFDPVDAYCAPSKQYWMLWTIRRVHESRARALERGTERDGLGKSPVDISAIRALDERIPLARMRAWPAAEAEERARALVTLHDEELAKL